jgi:hypothetical protein
MKRLICGVILFCVCISGVALQRGQSKGDVAVGSVAGHLVGRMLVDADGTAQWIGYCPYLAGINGSFFSGAPGEASAFFTFQSTPFQEQSIANGNLTVLFPTAISQPVQINVYFNPNPRGDFTQPNSFAQGQLIAHLTPQKSMGTLTGSVSTAAGTYDVIPDSNFTFGGQTYNLKKLTPALTISLTFGAPITGGDGTGSSTVAAFGGFALAVAPTPIS